MKKTDIEQKQAIGQDSDRTVEDALMTAEGKKVKNVKYKWDGNAARSAC